MPNDGTLFSYLGLRSNLTARALPIGDLYLDADNPRLFGEPLSGGKLMAKQLAGRSWSDGRVQEALRRTLEESHALQPLIDSLAALGYVPMDKIVVHEAEPGKFVVLEGNRRVACMKTILHCNHIHLRHEPEEVLATFRDLEVLVLGSTGEALAKDTFLLQGVRHIAGVRSWGPYQQARMVYACVVEKGLTYKDTAAAIGLSATRASAMLHAYLGVKQMEDHPEFGAKACPELFSHFDQAYKQPPVRDWLGWDENTRRYCHKANLERFYGLITGDEGQGQRPMTAVEVRDVFPSILQNDEAKEKLLAGRLSVAQAGALVPSQALNPSMVLRERAKGFLDALGDLPREHLLSREGRVDMKHLHEVYERLDELVRDYARKQIHKAVA
jgi:hypothetical protein